MQSPCIDACKTLGSLSLTHRHQQFPFSFCTRRRNSYPFISCNFNKRNNTRNPSVSKNSGKFKFNDTNRERVKVKGKENVWSIDNEIAKSDKGKEKLRRRKKREGKRMKNYDRKGDKVMVSGSMLMEVETVLQTQEPVIRPAWNTFTSSVSGIWKGVGAVFSPITAEMEPIEIGRKDENLFDCYTLSYIKATPPSTGAHKSQIQRKIDWITLNPYGEAPLNGSGNGSQENSIDQSTMGTSDKNGEAPLNGSGNGSQENSIDQSTMGTSDKKLAGHSLPKLESFDFSRSDVMEEDVMGMEPGLVFFEDGSYSRGPVDIPVGDIDESKYYLSPTFKFEQCLVKGCHKRLRVVHTIEFSNGGSDIQIMRVAIYEEQWVGPANISDNSDLEADLKPFSLRKRVQPSELTGSWKVFEMSATPVYGEEEIAPEESNGTPYVYLCTENLKKRSLPENPVYFGEEEMLDMQDVTVMWLPGGVTAYVDVNKDGILCIGVGWYSDEGINLVMERDYGLDGKLKEVRWKSEMKRRWTNPPPM